MDLRENAQTMSLDGQSHGENIEGLSPTELRTVMYIVVFPNLLVSLHPDYVMTHRLTPLEPGKTYVECSWAFPKSAIAKPGLRPGVRGGLLGSDQPPGLGCLRVGAARGVCAAVVPGPLAPDEDGVHHFVSRIAHGYAGRLDSSPLVTEDAEAAELAQA